jgi:hypothetical protein
VLVVDVDAVVLVTVIVVVVTMAVVVVVGSPTHSPPPSQRSATVRGSPSSQGTFAGWSRQPIGSQMGILTLWSSFATSS